MQKQQMPRCFHRGLEPGARGRRKRQEAVVRADAGAAAGIFGVLPGVPQRLHLDRPGHQMLPPPHAELIPHPVVNPSRVAQIHWFDMAFGTNGCQPANQRGRHVAGISSATHCHLRLLLPPDHRNGLAEGSPELDVRGAVRW